jgi:hypothetical protein
VRESPSSIISPSSASPPFSFPPPNTPHPTPPPNPSPAGYEAACAFASYANWLIPGRLLVGRYPYVEPSRCASYDQGEAQLDDIMAAGVHVFVSLQAEVPPQGDMKVGGVGGFMPYKAVAELIAAANTP